MKKNKKTMDTTYLRMAKELSRMSYAKRSKVGCLIVNDKHIISEGYNGTLPGESNVLEIDPATTSPFVIHAEENALDKLTKSTQSSKGSTLYVTLSPCLRCAIRIVNCGISRVVYSEEYRDITGLEYLEQNNVEVEYIKI